MVSVVEFDGCVATLVVVIFEIIVEFAGCTAVLAVVVEVCTIVGVSVVVTSGWLLVWLLSFDVKVGEDVVLVDVVVAEDVTLTVSSDKHYK